MQTRQMIDDLAKMIETKMVETLGVKVGFCLLIFPFHFPGITNYVSNADRKDMIKALRETADRLERREDKPRSKQ